MLKLPYTKSGVGSLKIDFLASRTKVGKPKMVNDHPWCTRLGVERFLCGPKMANYKSDGLKRMQ